MPQRENIREAQQIYPTSISFSLPQVDWFDRLFEVGIFLGLVHVLGHWVFHAIFQLSLTGISITIGLLVLGLLSLWKRNYPTGQATPISSQYRPISWE